MTFVQYWQNLIIYHENTKLQKQPTKDTLKNSYT